MLFYFLLLYLHLQPIWFRSQIFFVWLAIFIPEEESVNLLMKATHMWSMLMRQGSWNLALWYVQKNLDQVGPGSSGSGSSGPWIKWDLDQVGLDQVGLDQVDLDQVGPHPIWPCGPQNARWTAKRIARWIAKRTIEFGHEIGKRKTNRKTKVLRFRFAIHFATLIWLGPRVDPEVWHYFYGIIKKEMIKKHFRFNHFIRTMPKLKN
jgi:hypothetical protein